MSYYTPAQLNLLEPDEGQKAGKHPNDVTKAEYEAAGYKLDTPMKTIRKFCLECVGDQPSEVRKCTAVSCQLWPFRLGSNPAARYE